MNAGDEFHRLFEFNYRLGISFVKGSTVTMKMIAALIEHGFSDYEISSSLRKVTVDHVRFVRKHRVRAND